MQYFVERPLVAGRFTPDELVTANSSIEDLINAISAIEQSLNAKLQTALSTL